MKNLIRAFLLLPWLLIPPAFADYTDHGNGTVTDNATGLMWDKCSWGQTWSSNTCSGTASTHIWSAALGIAVTANSTSHRGYNDWRLPNKNELESLVKLGSASPAIDQSAFPSTPSSRFWSSTNYAPFSGYAWSVSFGNGYVYYGSKSYDGYVRLVRGGQLFDALHTVTATVSGTGGTITPPSQIVNHGAATTFTVNPNSGYSIASVTGCDGTLNDNTYTTGAITGDCTVTASFKQNQSIGAMSFNPDSIKVGESSTVRATATSNLSVSFSSTTTGVCTVSGNAVTALSVGTCTIAANQAGNDEYNPAPQVTGNLTVGKTDQSISAVSFSPSTIKVGGTSTASATATSNLSVSFSSTTTGVCTVSGNAVTAVSSGTCTIAANQVGNAAYNAAPQITGNLTVSQNSYTVTATAGAGGTITPPSQSVNSGATATFTVNPNSGYSIASVTGCGGTLNGNTYTTGAITAACTVSASFKQNAPTSYTVTATAGAGGSINPFGTHSVKGGETISFTVKADAGFAYDDSASSSTCPAGSWNGNVYTTGAITSDCAVSVNFKAKPLAAFAGLVFNGDYNGDGKADLIWHNRDSGDAYGILLDGFDSILQGYFYHEPNTTWQIVQNGDFQGRGYDSLLWWNRAEGWVYHATVPVPGRAATGTFIYHEPRTAWQIVAVGDLNGDGRDDLIWWNDQTGQVWGMLTDDALLSGLPAARQGQMYQETNTNWRIVAARDFNGDGNADLLWRNQQTGEIYLMLMNGLDIVGRKSIYAEPRVNEWNIVAVGDLNGDGKADLVWWNSQSGMVWGMLMDGFVIKKESFYQEPDTNWHIVSSGDYNGDGKDDLLWRHQVDGCIYQMQMDGLKALPGAVIYNESNPNWRIVANADENAATGIPTPSRSLSGRQQFAPLGTELLNFYPPLEGEPLNPNLLPK